MYAEAKKEKEEGYMGTQYDSSEDMAVDMLKKGITEKEKEESLKEGEDVFADIDDDIAAMDDLLKRIIKGSEVYGFKL